MLTSGCLQQGERMFSTGLRRCKKNAQRYDFSMYVEDGSAQSFCDLEIKSKCTSGHMLLYIENKAGYTATAVACGWAGAIFEVTRPFGQEQWGQKNKIIKKSKM